MDRYQLANAAMAASMGLSANGGPVVLEARDNPRLAHVPVRLQDLQQDADTAAVAAELAQFAENSFKSPFGRLTRVLRRLFSSTL